MKSPAFSIGFCMPKSRSRRIERPDIDETLLPSRYLTLSASGCVTRLNRFTCVTAWTSLCLRLTHVVTFMSPRLDSRWVGSSLSGAGISPAESAGFILAHQSTNAISMLRHTKSGDKKQRTGSGTPSLPRRERLGGKSSRQFMTKASSSIR